MVIFNASTGSDSAASGAGPATALTGTAAATAASALVTLAVDNPNLSGVATDGSAVLWVLSSSGRQFSPIIGVNNTTKVVTVANAYANTEIGKTWAIGGKRATFDNTSSRLLFSADILSGWTVVTQTDQTLSSSAISCAVSSDGSTGAMRVQGSSATVISNVFQGANAYCFNVSGGVWQFTNLKMSCTNGTRTSAGGITCSGTGLAIENCTLGDATNTLATGVYASAGPVQIIKCLFSSITGKGVNFDVSASLFIGACRFDSTGGNSVYTTGSSCSVVVDGCTFDNPSTTAILANSGSTGLWVIKNCVFDTISGAGWDVSAGVMSSFSTYGNNFTACTSGVVGSSAFNAFSVLTDYNDFYNNTTSYTNVATGPYDLSVDPMYIGGGDYTPTNPILQGAALGVSP